LDWVLRGARGAGLAFDTDERSPIYNLQPDWRAQIHNEIGKFNWSFKDRIVGFGLGDRDFSNLTIDDIHEFTERRAQEPPERLPEKAEYSPTSLKALMPAIRSANTKDTAAIDESLVEVKSLWSAAGLRAPDSVKTYVVQPGDTLESIAEKQLGNAELGQLILLHNQNAGLLYRAQELYAGRPLELPIYNQLRGRL
jgi:LysM repeat protein